MIYHPDLRIAYLAPPRTASRSVAAMLEQHGFVQTETGGRHDVILKPVPGWTSTNLPTEWNRVIVTIRNHWDTLVSWYGYHIGSPAWAPTWGKYSFAEWLEIFFEIPEETGVHRATPPRMWGHWLPHATHVVRFERLEKDLREVLPFKFDRLPRIRTEWDRDGRHYSEFYTDADAERVAQAYAEEIRELDYGY